MGIRDRFSNFFRRSVPTPSRAYGRMFNNSFQLTTVVSADTALENSDIYATVNEIASSVANLKITTTQPQVQTVLNQPSNVISGFNFWQSTVATMLLYGNAYVVIERNQANMLSGLTLLQERNVQGLSTDQQGNLLYQIQKDDDLVARQYPASQVLHFRLLTVGNTQERAWLGQSPLVSLVPELGIQQLSNQLIKSTLKNGINPMIALTVPNAQIDATAKASLRDVFLDATTGDNLGKPIVLDQSAQMSKIDISPSVSDFLGNISFTREQVAKAYGLPVSYIGGNSDAQSSIDMVDRLYQSSMQRYVNAIQSELTNKLGQTVSLVSQPTDDAIINRLVTLKQSEIITSDDAQTKLKEVGLI